MTEKTSDDINEKLMKLLLEMRADSEAWAEERKIEDEEDRQLQEHMEAIRKITEERHRRAMERIRRNAAKEEDRT